MVQKTSRYARQPGQGGSVRVSLDETRFIAPRTIPKYSVQDWELFKVFDGKTELSESEDEVAFEMSGSAELDEGLTHATMLLAH